MYMYIYMYIYIYIYVYIQQGMCGPQRPGAEKMATRTVNSHGMSRHFRDASTPSSKSGLSVSMIARAHLCESARGSRRVRLPRLPWRETISARTRWCKAGSADVGLPAQCPGRRRVEEKVRSAARKI